MKILSLLMVAVLNLSLSGCVSMVPMPLTSAATSIEYEDKGILIARISIFNQVMEDYQPELISVILEKGGKEHAYNGAMRVQRAEGDEYGYDYLVSMNASDGKASLVEFQFMYNNIIWVAFVDLPMKQLIQFRENEVVYIGNVEAVIAPRDYDEQDEPSAGSVLKQANSSAGFSRGIWHVSVTDQYHRDVSLFKKAFPALKHERVSKQILSEWVHPLKR